MVTTQQTTTIAIDAMGGDFGPEVIIPAAISFLKGKANKGVNAQNDVATHHIILVGLEDQVTSIVSRSGGDQMLKAGVLSVHNATQLVEMDEPPALALKRKKDSSMRVAINLVKEGVAQAAVSAGNTGALMATAKFVLKTIPGIARPAIISTMPCKDISKTLHVLDLGANVDSSPEMLVQFAVMGSALTEYVDKKPQPRVALLNVGAEEIKGSEKVKAASVLLAETDLNYVGYIEADSLLDGDVDVIVCDGFEGNVALKASEGTARIILEVMREEFGRNIFTKLVGALCLPVFRAMRTRLDPRVHNGATLLGLTGIVVKSHGGADEIGFIRAIEEANSQAERDIIGTISKEISKIIN